MQTEGGELEIKLTPEGIQVSPVTSVNGKTGDVVLTTSDLENTSDYQTGDEVDAAIATAIAGKQDTLTAGNNIQISAENVISATDTTYSAGNGLNLSSENVFSVDTTVVATQQNLATEVQNRENADNALQAQIDGISASSDVVDIVGTYADLQNYDTQHLKDNDIIKVLQDETQNDATTYYRWSTSTETFTLIGQEGPYYTKSAADAQFVPQTRTVNGQALSSNVTLTASDVGALAPSNVVQTTGTSTSQIMSQNATTQALGTKLNITDYVVDDELKNSTNPVQNGVLFGLLGDMPTDFFSGNATTEQTGTEAQFTNALKISDIELNGDTFQQTYSGKNLYNSPDRSQTRYGVTAAIANNIVTINGTATRNVFGGTYFNLNGTDDANANYYNYDNTTSGITLAAGTYTLSLNNITGSFTTTAGVYVRISKVYAGSFPTELIRTIELTSGFTNGSFTLNESATIKIQLQVYIPSDTSVAVPVFNNYSFDLQLESGSTATSFEPYVGGTASPNPDYPQDVQVVTGTQTVTISDGVNSQDYTVNLGSIELCKIGTYQDYIYKSGDDWYVHKEIWKIIADGSTVWTKSQYGTNNYSFVPSPTSLSGDLIQTLNNKILIFSDKFTGVSYNDRTSSMQNITYTAGNLPPSLWIRNNRFDTVEDLTAFCASTPITFYYVLATATDTQITDSTLIGQLNALYNAKMLAGQTNFAVSSVSPNLPAILDITVFNANAQGLIANIRG